MLLDTATGECRFLAHYKYRNHSNFHHTTCTLVTILFSQIRINIKHYLEYSQLYFHELLFHEIRENIVP